MAKRGPATLKFNQEEKWCPGCEKWLNIDAFARNSSTPSGRQCYCKSCHHEKQYGTSEEFEKQLAKQKFRCAVCDVDLQSKEWQPKKDAEGKGFFRRKGCQDHNHVTGQKRGVLCGSCNRGLGCLQDNPTLLEKAAAYLRSYEPQRLS